MLDFEEFVAVRWTALVRAAVLMGADQHAAEDMVQTTLAKCFLSWDRIARTREPDGYVFRMLFNTLRAARRRRWTGERPTASLPEDQSEDAFVRVDDSQAVLDALRRLPVGQRKVLVLRFFADYTEAQVAELLSISIGTVKSRTARALDALAESPHLSVFERNHQG